MAELLIIVVVGVSRAAVVVSCHLLFSSLSLVSIARGGDGGVVDVVDVAVVVAAARFADGGGGGDGVSKTQVLPFRNKSIVRCSSGC